MSETARPQNQPATVSKVVWKSMRPGKCTATGRAPSEEPLSANVAIQIGERAGAADEQHRGEARRRRLACRRPVVPSPRPSVPLSITTTTAVAVSAMPA